jgi:hypothetical protein
MNKEIYVIIALIIAPFIVTKKNMKKLKVQQMAGEPGTVGHICIPTTQEE